MRLQDEFRMLTAWNVKIRMKLNATFTKKPAHNQKH